MMDNTKPVAQAGTVQESSSGDAPEASAAPPTAEPIASPAETRFKSCRWRAAPDQGAFCTHRDVLPFAGKVGFSADSWCLECAFYKLRRTPKKRDYSQY